LSVVILNIKFRATLVLSRNKVQVKSTKRQVKSTELNKCADIVTSF